MCPTAFGWTAWRDGSCPAMNTDVEWQSHHNCLGCEVDGVTLILIECKLIIISPATVIVDRFLLPVIIVADAGWCQLTQLRVRAQGISAHGKVFHTVAANESQVVMASLQVIYHCTLVLSFFSAPQTEGQPTPLLKGLRRMDPPQAHVFGWFGTQHTPKEVDVLRGSFGHAVSSPEVFLASPHLPHLMDLRAHEVIRGSHFLEGRKEAVHAHS